MKSDDVIYYLITFTVGIFSIWLARKGTKTEEARQRHKIKSDVWRKIFSEIEEKLNRDEVRPTNPENLEVVRLELSSALAEYLNVYPSQAKYLGGYLDRLDKSKDFSYKTKIKVLRRILGHLKEPILL